MKSTAVLFVLACATACVEPVSEDCLYLNLWAPATPAKARLPVMVYLHGGAFRFGSPSTPLYWGHKLAVTAIPPAPGQSIS